ncbi:NAD(P)-binding protein [Pholiota conissans]|uniref:NAD(P)-binding protein n=1 Tax=Pholiota conissans TaxID=109636 RepID=A0A9P5Z0Z6_9AGAR|nr:NAD(P)-binding protein [Pholiota conissans]
MAGELILVTGVAGFIASNVAEQLLERGYRVRGYVLHSSTARGPKYQLLTKTVNKPGLEFVQIDDIATGDFTAALEGVDAVIHLAAALPGKRSIEETHASAIEGTLNVVRQAQKAGVKKFVVTGSFGSLLSPTHMPAFAGLTFTEADWGTTSDEEFEQQRDNKFYVYFAAKLKAELALWEFAEQHPDLQVATVLPGYVIGPYTETFPLPTNVESMGTNDYIHGLLNGGEVPFAPNWIVDVRDVARGHVRAFEELPNASGRKDGRFIVSYATYTWGKAAAYLKETRPDVKDRIVPLDTINPLPGVLSNLDNSRTNKVLGMGEYYTVEQSLDAAVDAVLKLEKHWKSVN